MDKNSNIKKTASKPIISVLCSLFFVFCFGVFLWQGIYLSKDLVDGEKLFLVEKGQGLFQIAENLEKEGLIKNKYLFDFYVFIQGKAKKLQAGEYKLNSAMNAAEIAKKIISGDIAKITVTIPEGWTQKQIEERLGLKLPGEDLEGFLFPDTYQFPINVKGEEVVEKMQANFQEKTKHLEITPEIVIMASLLEKEVKTKEEKELVADVLWRRLEIGMPLQVDAAPETYERQGLPAAPICNPGLESIMTALYPKENSYWYYLSTPEGETIFSKTLEEHNIAKAKYLN